MKRMCVRIPGFGAALLLVALFAGVVRADRRVDETRGLDAAGRLEIEMISGSVRVIGWDREEVRVEGTLEEDVEDLFFEGDRKRLVIGVKPPSNIGSNDTDAHLTVRVPRECEVEISTISADMTVEEFRGELIAESVSGGIDLAGRTTDVEAETVSGGIRVRGGKERIRAHSVSGRIEIAGFEGVADLETVSGQIRVDGGSIDRLRVESVSGEVRFTGDLHKKGTYRFDVHSGEVILAIDGEAVFHVETFSGDIENEFGLNGRRTSRYTSGRKLKFTLGDGGANVRIETFSGDVTIRKK